MTPIPPPALFMLIEQGWPVGMLMQVGVQRINGISNNKSEARGQAADPDFARLLMAFQRLQASGALGLRVEVPKESKMEGMVMTISQKNLPPRFMPIGIWSGNCWGCGPICKISRLSMAGYRIKMTWSLYRRVPDYKSWLNWVPTSGPAEHIAELRTYPPVPESGSSAQSLPPLIRIHADKSQPADAFAAVKYRDYWYWIDDRDFRSKGIFTFLMIIMTLAEKGENVQAPIATIQGN